MKKNLLLQVDSYKQSHFMAYPVGTEAMMSYIEARTGEKNLFFGLQIYLKDYLLTPITQKDIDEAEIFFTSHGEPFNREGWKYILKNYNGFMPVTIKAVPEGTVVPNRNVLVTIECNDPKCYWVASFLETSLLRGVWYPTTVATNSYLCKEVIKKNFELTSDNPDDVSFRLHDFGARGVSSGESAAIGGAAHLVNFMGSDTVEGVVAANRYYGVKGGMAAFSIPATEHSNATQFGKENEIGYFRHQLKNSGPGKIFACVGDSFDVRNAAKLVSTELKDELIASGATMVFRPDSGDPVQTPIEVIQILMEGFGFTVNSKGYKVLPSYIRVIQGDGIDLHSIEEIYAMMKYYKLAADNISFGMGGGLLQHVNRDTFGYAMKCCWIKENGVEKEIFKEAPGKNSKRGRLGLYKNYETGEYVTANDKEFEKLTIVYDPILETVYQMTDVYDIPETYFITFDEVRENSNK